MPIVWAGQKWLGDLAAILGTSVNGLFSGNKTEIKDEIDFYEWYNPFDWRFLGFDHDDAVRYGPMSTIDLIKLGIIGYSAFWIYSEYRSPTRKTYSRNYKYGRRGFKYGKYSTG